MLTRIWQHRYQGLLATCLLGVAAAILIMLLPDRQQAFARFALNPSAVSGDPVQSLLNDQRIMNRVLQQIEIEPPNPLDPRPVEPADAFKRNFGLRPTGAPDEYEISYVGRTNERALQGVSSWMQVASQLYGAPKRAAREPAAAKAGANETGANDQQASLQAALSDARANEQSLDRRAVAARSDLEQAQARLAALDEQLARARQDQTAARAARESNRQARQRQAQSAAQERTRLSNAVLTQRAQRELAAERVAQLQRRLEAAGKAGANGGASGGRSSDPALTQAQSEVRSLDRQSSAVRRELAQAGEQGNALAERLANTPEQITEVVSEPTPPAPADEEKAAALSREKATLAELRIRFTDNHPDVRRQLAIIADLESPGSSSVSQAPTIGARSVTRANPEFARLQAEQAANETRAANLRERLARIESSRRDAQARIDAANRDNTAGAARAREQLASLTRQLGAAQAALNQARDRERAAEQALAAADAKPAAPAPSDTPLAPNEQALTALTEEHQALSGRLKQLRATSLNAAEALAVARQKRSDIEQELARQSADATPRKTNASPALALAGMQWVQGPQVVPALDNPYRPEWLLAALLASLAFGVLVAFLYGLRRTTFDNVNELERFTGLRALGAVPRFKARGSGLRVLVSLFWFVLLLALYVALYLAFIAMVEAGGTAWPIDWPALKAALIEVAGNVATHLDIESVWLNLRGNAR